MYNVMPLRIENKCIQTHTKTNSFNFVIFVIIIKKNTIFLTASTSTWIKMITKLQKEKECSKVKLLSDMLLIQSTYHNS